MKNCITYTKHNQTYPNFLHKQIGILKDFFTFSCFRSVSTLIKDADKDRRRRLPNRPTSVPWLHRCTNWSKPSTPPNFGLNHSKTIMMSSKRSEGENYPSDQSHLLGSLVSFNLVRLFHEELVYLKLKLISKLTPTYIFNLLFICITHITDL